MVAGDTHYEGLLRRIQHVPHIFVNNQVRNQEWLMPARIVQEPCTDSSGISLGAAEENRHVIQWGSKLKCLNFAIDYVLNNFPPCHGRDKLNILLLNDTFRGEIVAGQIKDILGRRQITECPILLT